MWQNKNCKKSWLGMRLYLMKNTGKHTFWFTHFNTFHTLLINEIEVLWSSKIVPFDRIYQISVWDRAFEYFSCKLYFIKFCTCSLRMSLFTVVLCATSSLMIRASENLSSIIRASLHMKVTNNYAGKQNYVVCLSAKKDPVKNMCDTFLSV